MGNLVFVRDIGLPFPKDVCQKICSGAFFIEYSRNALYLLGIIYESFYSYCYYYNIKYYSMHIKYITYHIPWWNNSSLFIMGYLVYLVYIHFRSRVAVSSDNFQSWQKKFFWVMLYSYYVGNLLSYNIFSCCHEFCWNRPWKYWMGSYGNNFFAIFVYMVNNCTIGCMEISG